MEEAKIDNPGIYPLYMPFYDDETNFSYWYIAHNAFYSTIEDRQEGDYSPPIQHFKSVTSPGRLDEHYKRKKQVRENRINELEKEIKIKEKTELEKNLQKIDRLDKVVKVLYRVSGTGIIIFFIV